MSNPTLRVLILEDSEDDAIMVQHELARGGYTLISRRLETAEDFKAALAEAEWDVVISDYSMPALTAPEALVILQSTGLDIPFIIVSGTISEEVAVECMKAGADDFFRKERIILLVPAVEREIGDARARHQRAEMERRLRQSEERFKKVFHTSPVCTCLLAMPELTFLDVNERFLKLVGYERDELMGKSLRDLNLWGSEDSRLTVFRVFNQIGVVYDTEVAFRHKSGEIGLGLLSVESLKLEEQNCVVAMIHDITDRQRMAMAEREQRLFAATLQETASWLTTDLALDKVLEQILIEIKHILPYDGATVLLVDGEYAYVGGTHNYSRQWQDSLLQIRVKIQDTPNLVRMLETGQPVVIRDTEEYKGWRDLESPAVAWIRSSVGAPIRIREQTIGFLHLDSARPNTFTTADASRLQSFADQAAIAIHNAKLFAQLSESESRFRVMAENSTDMISRHSLRGEFLYVSPACYTLLDYLPNELLGRRITELVHPDDLNLIADSFTSLDNFPDMMTVDYRLRHRTGHYVWFEAIIRLIRDSGSGIPVEFQAASRDITERKRAEEELKSLYNATSTLFTADSLLQLGQQVAETVVRDFGKVDCGVMLVDRANNRMIRLARAGEYGVSTDQPLYLDGPGLVPLSIRREGPVYLPDVATNPSYVPNVPQTRSELVVPLRTAKGIVGALDLQSEEANAFSERDQRILTAFAERAAVAIEIMQLNEELNSHAAELEWRVAKRTAELRHAKERVEDILNNSSDAIVLTHADGSIRQTNPTFDSLFGYGVDELYRKPAALLIEPNHTLSFQNAMHEVLSSKRSVHIELICHRKDGRQFYADVGIAPVVELDQHQQGLIFSLRDVTRRKQAEEELRRTLEKEKELSELKSRFISMVSHEYRTPLAIILMNTSTLQKYWERLDEVQRAKRFVTIEEQIKHMTALLDDVLTIARYDAGRMSFEPMPTDVPLFCQTILDDIQSQSDHTHLLEFTCATDCPAMQIDHKLMRQIFTNLVSNAMKYSEHESVVHISLECHNDELTLKVRDEGIGIPESDQVHLFEPFHRATNVGTINGTGLGLSIVKRAVERHGGRISFDTALGAGTTFMVVLPVVEAVLEH